MMFYDWLLTQRDRNDHIGSFARRALAKKFPKHIKNLHAVLTYYNNDPVERAAAKTAHRVFRQSRKESVS